MIFTFDFLFLYKNLFLAGEFLFIQQYQITWGYTKSCFEAQKNN